MVKIDKLSYIYELAVIRGQRSAIGKRQTNRYKRTMQSEHEEQKLKKMYNFATIK